MPQKRAYYEQAAELNGYIPVDDVNKNLTILVCASLTEDSTKLAKARKLALKIMEIDDWLQSLEKMPEDAGNDESDGQLSLF